MLGWANVRQHVAAEITLLCDRHHRERTGGLLPIEAVREANANPFSLREGVSAPYDLHFSGTACEVEIGSNRFSFESSAQQAFTIPVGIDGIPLLGFVLDDGHLLLHLLLFDEFNSPVLQIVNNQLIYSVSPWDIQLIGRTLIVRDSPRLVLIDLTFEVPNRILVTRGRFLCNGVELLVTRDYALITNNRIMFSGNVMANCYGGIIIGSQDMTPGAAVRVAGVPRYFADREAAKKWAEESRL
jgi:hypothetical protein